jgi:hypothetical protein
MSDTCEQHGHVLVSKLDYATKSMVFTCRRMDCDHVELRSLEGVEGGALPEEGA